ncbi:MAG: HEAT repeat domain-containing protein [Nitrospirota bacterium]
MRQPNILLLNVLLSISFILSLFINNYVYAEDVNSLIRKLNDEEWIVRSEAAEALGNKGDKKAIPALVAALNDEENDEDVKWNIIWALGAIGDKEAVPALIEVLKDNDLQGAASKSLKRIGKDAVPDLTAALKSKYKLIRWSVADLLGIIGDPSAIPALMERVNDTDEGVAWSVRRALKRLGWKKEKAK